MHLCKILDGLKGRAQRLHIHLCASCHLTSLKFCIDAHFLLLYSYSYMTLTKITFSFIISTQNNTPPFFGVQLIVIVPLNLCDIFKSNLVNDGRAWGVCRFLGGLLTSQNCGHSHVTLE